MTITLQGSFQAIHNEFRLTIDEIETEQENQIQFNSTLFDITEDEEIFNVTKDTVQECLVAVNIFKNENQIRFANFAYDANQPNKDIEDEFNAEVHNLLAH